MGCSAAISLPVIYSDGELFECVEDFRIIPDKLVLKGSSTKRAYESRTDTFYELTCYYFNYEGIEYGTSDSLEAILEKIKAACMGDSGFFIFDVEFDTVFE